MTVSPTGAPAESTEAAPAQDENMRYDLDELFEGESPDNLHFLKVAGQVVLIALLAASVVFVCSKLNG